MSLLLVAAILLQAWGDSLPTPLPAADSLSRAAACGIAPARLHIRDDRELEESVIAVANGPMLSDSTLRCLAGVSVAGAIYAVFDDLDAQRRYQPIEYELEKNKGHADAMNWVKRRGLEGKLPSYSPDQPISAFGRKVEQVCGAASGSWLTQAGSRFLTLAPKRLDLKNIGKRDATADAQLACIMNVIAASDLDQQGGGFGFIGNEAATAEEPSRE